MQADAYSFDNRFKRALFQHHAFSGAFRADSKILKYLLNNIVLSYRVWRIYGSAASSCALSLLNGQGLGTEKANPEYLPAGRFIVPQFRDPSTLPNIPEHYRPLWSAPRNPPCSKPARLRLICAPASLPAFAGMR